MNDIQVRDAYFGSEPADKLAASVMRSVEDFYEYLTTVGRLQLLRRSYDAYYRGFFKGGRLNKVGPQLEYESTNVNHFRNLLNHMLVMTASQRPSFEPRATNTDFRSQAQTFIANGVCDYYMRDKEMDLSIKKATEHSLWAAEGYVVQEFDVNAGNDYGVGPGGAVVKQGDVTHVVPLPIDVIFDHTGQDPQKRQWYVVRLWENRWDLIARYPEKAERIRMIGSDNKFLRRVRIDTPWSQTSDLIPVYKLFHAKTPAVPNGRVFTCLDSDLWLIDGPLPYKKYPVHRIAGAEQHGTGFGYTVAFDLLPLQDALDILYSVILTNQSTFGVQNIAMPDGSNISAAQLLDGLNLIKYDPKFGKPEALNLTNTPPEIFKFIEMIEHTMETICGVNSVARGNPEANLKSGAALALVQSMAIQFNSGLQQSYAKLLESLGTGLVQILQSYASTPRIAAISGKSNRTYLKEFTGKDLANIDRVTVDMGNPLSRTTAGKVNMADNLLQAKLIENPQQYLQVLTTGKLEPMIENEQAEIMLIRAENEDMSEGKAVQALITDNHKLHIMEHRAVLSSPEARQDPTIVALCLQHEQEHLNLWRQADPALLQVTGQEMPPPPPPMLPPMGGAGAPQVFPGPVVPSAPPAGGGAPLDPTNPVLTEAADVGLPKMPQNALTGQPFDTATGGL